MIYHVDLVGSGGENDIFDFLKYYASERERRDWAKEFPEYDLRAI
jgi:hypothetical protein